MATVMVWFLRHRRVAVTSAIALLSIPVFLGPIGKQMVDASPEGGTLFVFELPSP